MSLTQVLDVCESLGISVKTHSSSMEDAQADRVRRKAAREGRVGEEPSPEEAQRTKAADVTAAPPQRTAETRQQQAAPAIRPPQPTTRPAATPPPSQGRPAPGHPVTSTTTSDEAQPGTMPRVAPLPLRRGGSEMGIVRSRYLAICDDLISDFEASPSTYTVLKNASFQDCLGYLQRYIVDKRSHYRFDRYAALLNPWYHENAFPTELAEHYWDSGRSRLRLLHIDLGSGPGLFTWVVRDYLDDVFWGPSWEYESMHIGYDHSASMVDLATVIWGRLAIGSKAVWCSSQESLLAVAQRPISSCDYLLITMGHVIIQLSNQGKAVLDNLADCVNQLLNDYDAPPTDVLIVDAHSGSRPQQFERALQQFVAVLDTPRDDAHRDHSAWHRMDLPSHVLPEGSRAAISNWRGQALLRSTSTGEFTAPESSEENPF